MGRRQMRSAPANGRTTRIVASQPVTSLHPHEDEGHDCHPAGDRERVRPHEPGLEGGHVAGDAPRAYRDAVDRAEDERALDEVPEAPSEKDRRPVEDPVVELVEVELVLEERANGSPP